MANGTGGSPARTAFYRPELDGLRLVAFLCVFVHHYLPKGAPFYERRVHLSPMAATWAHSVASVGALGVDLFFVLSSYLITNLLLRERQARGSVDVLAFYARRGLRIWPLYFVYLGLVLVIAHVDATTAISLGQAGCFAIFVGNWLPDLDLVTPLVVPLWSVCFEEQFYACWPWVARRLSARAMLWFCGALVLASMSARAVLAGYQEHHAVWFITIARLEPIAAGGALAVVLDRVSWRPSALARAALALGAAAACLLTVHFLRILESDATRASLVVGFVIVAVSASAAFLAAYGSTTSVLATPVFTYLGRISYGLYVWHELALYIGRHTVASWHTSGSGFILLGVVSLGVAVALAAASYHALEMPFLRLKDRFTYIPSGVRARASDGESGPPATLEPGVGEVPGRG